MVVFTESCEGLFFHRKIHVDIVNHLENHEILMIRCWSKDNSLGTHYLAFEENLEWVFYDQLMFGHTRFECNLQYRNGTSSIRGRFAVYDTMCPVRRRACTRHCLWGVGVYGLYAFDENDKKWDYEIPWPSKNNFEEPNKDHLFQR
ncbi:hypothetical protein M5689_023181 [Euphorbia peplus]|nr:hypothetical protein M5689_023181 [Euphorbia peplus]